MTRRVYSDEMFWGIGKAVSDQYRGELHRLIEECITIASGLQQPDHPESEAHAARCAEERREAAWELKHRVSRIARAFGYTVSA